MDNIKKKFLNKIKEDIDTINRSTDRDTKGKLELLAFCILVSIDGESVGVPPFSLRPIDEEGEEGEDIAGNLHDEFHNL